MALLESHIFSCLTGASGVSSVVGERIYALVLPQGCALPAISYFRVSGPRQMSLEGYSNLESPRIQIDCWATSYAQAKTLAAAVRAAMLSSTDFKVSGISDQDLFDESIGIFRVSTDFSVWHRDT